VRRGVDSSFSPGLCQDLVTQFDLKIVGPTVTSLVAFPPAGHCRHGIRSDAVQRRKTERKSLQLTTCSMEEDFIPFLGRQGPCFLGGASEDSYRSLEWRDARRSGSRSRQLFDLSDASCRIGLIDLTFDTMTGVLIAC
jgi:hypothetical protein